MRRAVRVMGVLAAVALAAGCAREIDGRAEAANLHGKRPLASGDLDSVLLAPSQISDIVGAKVQLRADIGKPVATDPAEGPCAALDTAGTQAFVGTSFAAFHLLLLSDGTDNDHDNVVTQAGAVYPDAAGAAKVFASASSQLPSCDKKEFTVDVPWLFAVNDVAADTVRWNKEQTNLPMLWVCYGQARLRDNVILQAMVCRSDDQGRANADTILDRMSASVWQLSGG